MHKKFALFTMLLITLLFLIPDAVFAQEGSSPEFSIAIAEITAPTECSRGGWSIPYDRTTPIYNQAQNLTRYFVQYVNGELNFVHYWGSGYDQYVQDYNVSSRFPGGDRIGGGYTIPFWTDTYEAETIEYTLRGDEVIWELRATLTCEAGEVTAYNLTSEPVQSTRDSLPGLTRNLVLALQDIPIYEQPVTRRNLLGTIETCQTFFIDNIEMPRASIVVWGRESITGRDIQLFDGRNSLQIVDVPENYGQPDGQPILEQCAGS